MRTWKTSSWLIQVESFSVRFISLNANGYKEKNWKEGNRKFTWRQEEEGIKNTIFYAILIVFQNLLPHFYTIIFYFTLSKSGIKFHAKGLDHGAPRMESSGLVEWRPPLRLFCLLPFLFFFSCYRWMYSCVCRNAFSPSSDKCLCPIIYLFLFFYSFFFAPFQVWHEIVFSMSHGCTKSFFE